RTYQNRIRFGKTSEPEGRGAAWTEERGACDERRGKAVPVKGAMKGEGEVGGGWGPQASQQSQRAGASAPSERRGAASGVTGGIRGGRLRARKYLRHNDVVENKVLEGTLHATPTRDGLSGEPAHPTTGHSEPGTRARIARLILEHGPATAAGLSARLGLTPAAIRRHLDNLLADGMIEAREARCYGSRGRGRPARLFAITDPGRSAFEHAYDDLATSALRFLAETAGAGAVAEFARRKISDLEGRYP